LCYPYNTTIFSLLYAANLNPVGQIVFVLGSETNKTFGKGKMVVL